MHERYAATYTGSFARSAAIPSTCGSLSLEIVVPLGSRDTGGAPAFPDGEGAFSMSFRGPAVCGIGRASGGSCPARGDTSVRGDALEVSAATSSAAFMLQAAKSAAVGTAADTGDTPRAKTTSAAVAERIREFMTMPSSIHGWSARMGGMQLRCRRATGRGPHARCARGRGPRCWPLVLYVGS